ncbi:MAG: potassium transporter Kup [Bacteriovorax sp.]|nr:potassium transporter Kup [Bacteriovorax sp.]
MTDHTNENAEHSIRYQFLLALSALGVVYGDIGTSPLYAFKESLHHGHNISLSESSIYGILSLIFWSLIIVISIKYLRFVLKADNRGEGGILALTALVSPTSGEKSKRKDLLVLFGLFGTALLYGDGMITPAISVLSAVEGLELITPIFTPYILPITIAILVGLFSVQKYGTSVMGKIFGPLTFIWFLTLGSLGIYNIIQAPSVLLAINPYYAFRFFIEYQWNGFMVLGSVFLVVTGGEALYSDLGHFGIKPIKRAWFLVALPCLLLNYFGQGALLTHMPEAIKNPFFLMAPKWMLTPLVLLATIATVIASQALITGVFSITMHAVHLGYIPRVLIKHTSKKEYGQIFVKSMNTLLMLACITLVLVFKTSSNLASAYGIAVTATMTITTVLFYIVATEKWNWSLQKAGIICGFFLIIDLAFLGANLAKVIDGGWVPLAVGLFIFTIMTTWKRGRKLLAERNVERNISLVKFLEILENEKPHRNAGTAIYMSSNLESLPYAFVNTFKHFKTIHENLIFLQVITKEIPHIEKSQRLEVKNIGHGCHIIVIQYGYVDEPNIPNELDNLQVGDILINSNEVTFFIGKENLFATEFPGMAIWRERLFAFQSANSQDATTYFQLPKKSVMEIGIQVEL